MHSTIYELSTTPIPKPKRVRAGNLPEWFYFSVCIETPIVLGFKSAECWLPQYEWKNIDGFSEDEVKYYDDYLRSLAHVIVEL